MINYHNKTFHAPTQVGNQKEISSFELHFKQIGKLIIAEISGHAPLYGHLLGKFTEYGVLVLHYHQINENGIIDYGICRVYPQVSTPNQMVIRLDWNSLTDTEKCWEWLAIESASSVTTA